MLYILYPVSHLSFFFFFPFMLILLWMSECCYLENLFYVVLCLLNFDFVLCCMYLCCYAKFLYSLWLCTIVPCSVVLWSANCISSPSHFTLLLAIHLFRNTLAYTSSLSSLSSLAPAHCQLQIWNLVLICLQNDVFVMLMQIEWIKLD
jgi:hypothetical protein